MKISELPFIIKKNITIKQTFDIKNNFFLEYRSANNPLGYSLTKIVKLYTDWTINIWDKLSPFFNSSTVNTACGNEIDITMHTYAK